MYMLTEVRRTVPIRPADLKDDIDNIIENLTQDAYEGRFGEDKMFTVLVKNVRTDGPGRIVHGDGSVYQPVVFDQVVFKPRENEIIIGVVVEVLKFGAFVRFGPLDGLLHISQVMDDHVDANVETQTLSGKETKRSLSVGDRVRARIVGLTLNEKTPQDSRIALTMRQPGLGKLSWIEEDRNKTPAEAEN